MRETVPATRIRLLTWLASLRVRLLLLIVVSTIPAGLLVLGSAAEQRDREADSVKGEALRLAHLMALSLDDALVDVRQMLVLLSQFPSLREANPEVCPGVLAAVVGQYPRYSSLAVARPDGDVVCNAVATPELVNLADRPYFQRALATGGFAVGDATAGRLTIPMAYPYTNPATGAVEFLLLGGLRLDWLTGAAERAALPTGSTVTVVDRGGAVLFRHPDPDGLVGRQLPDEPIVQAIRGSPGPGTLEAVEFDDVPRLYAFVPLVTRTETSPYLFVGIPADVAFAGVYAALLRNLLALGVTGVLIVSVAWWGSELLVVRRVHALRRLTERLAGGDLAARTTVGAGRSELDDLERAFDEMGTELQTLEARVRLEEQLREQNHALAEASRLKSEFLAHMSHELRTPLNSIIGFSELLVDEPPEGYDRETRDTYLATIHQSGQHLLELINDILDLSRVEAGRMDLRPAPFAVAALVGQVRATLEPLAARKRIAIELDTADAGELVADEARVRQILYNLLSNAIKFTPDGGRIRVEAHSRSDDVLLIVADTGIGIAPEDQERIFREFEQLDTGLRREHEGTGLGLPLTRRLVELHGGRIWLESERGRGSRFFVSLPRRGSAALLPDEAPGNGLAAPDGPAERPLVLVVEDDPSAARLLTQYLNQGGYRAVVVGDAWQVVEQTRALRPAAITLDILLPGLDGWGVLQALKRDAATREIPVVVISVVDEQTMGLAFGAVDYFVKPVDRRALLDRLDQLALTPARGRPVQVLIVDDEPATLDLLAAILEPAGYVVLRAEGGARGIEIAQAEPPDLCILDLMMPEVSGFDVVAALQANPATRRIPIIAMTAKDLSDADLATLHGSTAALLQKHGLSRSELLAWIDRLTAPTPGGSRGA